MAKVTEEEKIYTRKKILEVSRKIFFENGLENTSMKQIAKEAGIGTSTIYGYFPSKFHLLTATFCSDINGLYVIENAMENIEEVDLIKIISDYFVFKMKYVISLNKDIVKEFFLLFLFQKVSDEIHKEIMEEKRKAGDRIQKLLERYEIQRSFKINFDKKQMVTCIANLMHGHFIDFITGEKNQEDTIAAFIDDLEILFQGKI